jgi:hypothetical protein
MKSGFLEVLLMRRLFTLIIMLVLLATAGLG